MASAETGTPGITAQLAQQALRYRTHDLSERSRLAARRSFLDWFGVTLAGRDEPCGRIAAEEFGGGANGPCTLVGRTARAQPHDAAFVNGTTSHALDYDDSSARLQAHSSVVIAPAVLAVAEAEDRSGEDIVRAFIGGYEVAAALGSRFGVQHYRTGFHTTGTNGTFSAAIAAGLLMELDEDQMRCAIGLAATQAAGLKAMFGTMAKPFHAGRAGASGVMAARLAARGFTAHPDAIEAPLGFLDTHGENAAPGEIWTVEPGRDVCSSIFKYHAACHATHPTLEAISGLRREIGFTEHDVERIELEVTKMSFGICNIPDPKTGLESKFSLRQAAALAVTGADTTALATYSDTVARDPRLVALRERVEVKGIDGGDPLTVRVSLQLRSGRRAVAERTVGVETDLDHQGAALSAKFHNLVSPILGAGRAADLAGTIDAIETTSARALMALAVPAR